MQMSALRMHFSASCMALVQMVKKLLKQASRKRRLFLLLNPKGWVVFCRSSSMIQCILM